MTDALDALGDLLSNDPFLAVRQAALDVRYKAAPQGTSGKQQQAAGQQQQSKNAGKGAQTGKKGIGADGGKGGVGAYSTGHPFFGNQHTQVDSTGVSASSLGTAGSNAALENQLGAGGAAYTAAVAASAAKKKGGGGGSKSKGSTASAAAAAASLQAKALAAANLAAKQKAASAATPTPASDASANAINSLSPAQRAAMQAGSIPPAGYHWSNGMLVPTNGTGADAVAAKALAATLPKLANFKTAADTASNQPATAASAKLAAAINALPPAEKLATQNTKIPPAGFKWLNGTLVIARDDPHLQIRTALIDSGPCCDYCDNPVLHQVLQTDGTFMSACGDHLEDAVMGNSPEEMKRLKAKEQDDNGETTVRDAIGEMTGSSNANLLLPVGQPRKPVPQEATVIGPEPHKFQGTNVLSCTKCGLPLTANVHRGKKSAQQRAETRLPFVRSDPSSIIAARAAFDNDLHQIEGKVQGSMRALFAKQRQATISRLTGDRGKRMLKRAAEEPTVPSIVPSATDPQTADSSATAATTGLDTGQIFDTAFWGDQTAQALNAHFGTIAAQSAARVQRQLKIPLGEVADHDSLAATDAVLAGRAKDSAMKITGTTRDQIFDALREGTAAGEGIPALADRVNKVFDNADAVRAKMIAQTEVVGATNQAAMAYAQNLPDGLVAYKQWLAHHDERTRPTHRVADGQQQPLDQPFSVGASQMMMPHDPTAPPGEVINCRCGVGFTKEPGFVTTPAKLKGLVPQTTLDALARVQEKQAGKYPALAGVG